MIEGARLVVVDERRGRTERVLECRETHTLVLYQGTARTARLGVARRNAQVGTGPIAPFVMHGSRSRALLRAFASRPARRRGSEGKHPETTSASRPEPLGVPPVPGSWTKKRACRDAHVTRTDQPGCDRGAMGPDPAAVRGARVLERVAGIEPASSAWEAEVLPLNYTRRRASIIPERRPRTRARRASPRSAAVSRARAHPPGARAGAPGRVRPAPRRRPPSRGRTSRASRPRRPRSRR